MGSNIFWNRKVEERKQRRRILTPPIHQNFRSCLCSMVPVSLGKQIRIFYQLVDINMRYGSLCNNFTRSIKISINIFLDKVPSLRIDSAYRKIKTFSQTNFRTFLHNVHLKKVGLRRSLKQNYEGEIWLIIIYFIGFNNKKNQGLIYAFLSLLAKIKNNIKIINIILLIGIIFVLFLKKSERWYLVEA